MKSTKNFLILFAFSLIFLTANGCSDLNSDKAGKSDGIFVSGRVSIPESGAAPSVLALQNHAARTAMPSFKGIQYTVTARPDEGGDQITAKTNSATGTFVLKIPSAGTYSISAEYAGEGIRLSASTRQDLDETSVINLGAKPELEPGTPSGTEKGSIKLLIKDESSVIKTVKVSMDVLGTSLSKEIDFSAHSGFFEVSADEYLGTNSDRMDVYLFSGSYMADFEFYDEAGELRYSCLESILVYPGFVTDLWYGNGAHIQGNDFVVTDNLLEKFGRKVTSFVLWNDSEEENRASYSTANGWGNEAENSGLTKGMQIFSGFRGGLTVSEPLPQTSTYGVSDFCFDEKQNLYVLTGGTVYKYKKCFEKYIAAGSENLSNALSDKNMGTASIIDFQYADGVLWVIFNGPDDSGSPATFNYLAAVKSDFTEENVSTTFSSYVKIVSGGITDAIDCFAVHGEYAYIARNYEAPDKDGNMVHCYNVSRADLSLTEEAGLYNITLNMEGSFNDADITPDVLGISEVRKISVNDMQIAGDSLYVLISTELGAASRTDDAGSDFTFCCKGGVVKIPLDSFGKTEEFTGAEWADFGLNKVYGWYVAEAGEETCQLPIENLSGYFYCPRKFISRSANELIIADDGIYNHLEGDFLESTNINRVLTIDLNNPSTEMGSYSVGVMFTGQADSDGYLK
ncbi:MAG: carboxypeptidase regulatory-like domain-containing protein [Treponema sp.]|nr:carboxypeptidase regulatory-like domain-containing protein [Treponema sp.]